MEQNRTVNKILILEINDLHSVSFRKYKLFQKYQKCFTFNRLSISDL